jgi:HK97 family phage portal protein
VRSPVGTLVRTISNKAPIPYTGRSQVRLPWTHKTGAEAQMRAMGSVSTLFAIVSRLAEATAAVDWKLYRKGRPGIDPEEREEVPSHAALTVWNRPNDFMTRQELVASFQQHLDLVGEGWIVTAVNRVASRLPIELWPVRPDRIEPLPDPKEFLTGYLYTGPDGQQIELAKERVIQLCMPNPLDPYRGLGPVQALLTDLDATRYSAEWNRSFFLNSAEPGGIIEYERRLSDEEFDEVSARWAEQHKGVANAHKVAIIEQGKWVDRKYSMRDMQFTELRTVAREIIREAFGFPKPLLGAVDDVNRANAEAAEVMFARWLVIPRLERIKQALNNDFLPLFGTAGVGVEFDYCNPVPNDREADDRERESKAGSFVALVNAGVHEDDAADAVGLPQMRFERPAPDRSATADRSGPRPLVEAPAAARLDIHHHALGPALEGPRPVGLSMSALAALDSRRSLRADAGDGMVRQVRADHEAALEQVLADWANVAEAQYAQIAEQVQDAARDADPARLARLEVDTATAEALLRGALGGMAATGARRMADEAAAQGVPVTPPTVDESLRNTLPRGLVDFGGELVAIARATAGLLASRTAVAAGQEALRLFKPGAVAADVAARVVEFLRGMSPRGLRDVLGGALHRATNLGRFATLQVAPAARYLATEVNDQRRCEPCAQIDGTQFADLAAAWATYAGGGYQWCEGGDRCRGTVTARWEQADG